MRLEDPMPALGVHSLDHFALEVPDLTEAADFFSAFGLDVRPEGDSAGLYTFGQPYRWAVLLPGARKRLHHLSFGIFAEDLARFRAQLKNSGIEPVDPPQGIDAQGLWVTDSDGVRVELRVAPKSSPAMKPSCEFVSSPPGEAGAPKRSAASRVRPTHLSHCLTFTRSVPRSIEFYTRVLGLKLSDRCGDDIAFLHGIHGSDHHLIAFARSEAPGLHHSAWCARSVNEIGLGAMQMAAKGYTQGWGMGRHVLGSNYFHYVRDPYGSHCEYTCDMDYIPAGLAWEARDHAPEDAFYVWGPNPPPDWTRNREAETNS
jgi:catechol 2,3-dioxygenase